MFDAIALKLQLAWLKSDKVEFDKLRQKVVDIASSLEEKQNVPAIKKEIEYLSAIQQKEFWLDITLEMLESLRIKVRELAPFIDKKQRNMITTNFEDEITEIRAEDLVNLPTMTSPQYEQAVKDYLQAHINQAAIQKLYTNQPLTSEDKTNIEASLTQLGDEDGEQLLSHLLAARRANDVLILVRQIVGLNRAVVVKFF